MLDACMEPENGETIGIKVKHMARGHAKEFDNRQVVPFR